MKHRYIQQLTLLATLATALNISAQQAPRLVVNIIIDQLRTDYMQAFSPLYGSNGFKRLLNQGLVYQNGYYPFAPIDRASATAAISSGTTPYYNGVVGRRWLNRETLRPIFCVDDKQFKGIFTDDCSSAVNIKVSTIGDELKMASLGKSIIYSIAPERDAAIMLAGHAADAAIWIDDVTGFWCSSTYYQAQAPEWLAEYNKSKALIDSRRNTWQPYSEKSGSTSYFMGGGMQKPFNHKFSGENQYRTFKTSGLVNEAVTDIATKCVTSASMGIDPITDILYVTYYAGKFDHRPLAECQMELQDTYLRLDNEIDKLISNIQRKIGENNVMFVVTATGYGEEETNDYGQYRIPTGTFYMNRATNLLNMYFGAIWGQGNYVDTAFGQQIYLNHKLLEKQRISLGDATHRAQEFLMQMSGVRNVYTAQQLQQSSNENFVRTRNFFNVENSGDILIEVAPGWRSINEDTMESSVSIASFIQFPIIFFGANVAGGTITLPTSVDRIAPTISRAIRIRAPNACSSEPLF
ncbi:MAG: alkaline phosphatase family protein [Prevotella sp.]|nr:alkaline phosphatase family protein [Prevotella sp.]